MQLKFWGVRGSIPHSLDTPGWVRHIEGVMRDFFAKGFNSADQISKYLSSRSLSEVGGFGVSTTCVQIEEGKSSLIIDGGSGIKSISDDLQKKSSADAPREFHILISHFHFDHIVGLPFFLPHFKAGCKINYYSVQPETKEIVKSLFQKPIFPVGFGNLSADIEFHILKPYEENHVNGFSVIPYQTDHPDLCYGFKIEKNNKRYAHAVDNEAVRLTRAQLGSDGGLYENVDLLYFDAQYDESAMNFKKGWGHGSSHRGFEICANYNIKQILFAHHDPSFSIEDSLEQQRRTEQVYKEKYSGLNLSWSYAYDGLVVKI